MGFFDGLLKSGRLVGSSLRNRVKKEFQDYMAPERAQKVVDKEKEIPKRAPMNVPKHEFTNEEIQLAKKELEFLKQKNTTLTSNMDQVKIISNDPEGVKGMDLKQHSHQRSDLTRKTLPKQRYFEIPQSSGVPRGLVSLPAVINILHNHRISPEDWNSQTLAKKTNLRESDVTNLIKHFSLLTGIETKTKN